MSRRDNRSVLLFGYAVHHGAPLCRHLQFVAQRGRHHVLRRCRLGGEQSGISSVVHARYGAQRGPVEPLFSRYAVQCRCGGCVYRRYGGSPVDRGERVLSVGIEQAASHQFPEAVVAVEGVERLKEIRPQLVYGDVHHEARSRCCLLRPRVDACKQCEDSGCYILVCHSLSVSFLISVSLRNVRVFRRFTVIADIAPRPLQQR